jgi:hypothetical protein
MLGKLMCGPRRTITEENADALGLIVRQRQEDEHAARGRERVTGAGGADGRQASEYLAEASNLDAKTDTVGVVWPSRTEDPPYELVPLKAIRPTRSEHEEQIEEYGPPRHGDSDATGPHETAARVDEKRVPRRRRLHVPEVCLANTAAVL